MSAGSTTLDAIAFFDRSLGEARAHLAALVGALAAGDRLAVVTAAFSLRRSLRTARDHVCTITAVGRGDRYARLAELEAHAGRALEDARDSGLLPPEGDRSGTDHLWHREEAVRQPPERAASARANDDMQALGDRMEAERLLSSKDVTSGQDATRALEILLGRPALVDKLSQRAFDNVIDRLSEDQRARMAPLVDASQDPKRKLMLWAAQHKGRARDDLRRYEGNFGDPDRGEQTDAQAAAQRRYERRRRGVERTEAEVDKEVELLAAKGHKLTGQDLDEVRARKDKELDVEIKHNIDLVAEGRPREDMDKTRVVWSQAEVAQLDASLSKLPDQHVRDEGSPERYIRRANSGLLDTRGGEYQGNEISIFDHVHDAIPGRAQAPAVEYAITHEIGHEVETENKAAFARFERTAGWQRYEDRDALEKSGLGEDDIDQMGSPHKVGDKVYEKNSDGSYHAADETAIPSFDETRSDRWKYAATNAQEHWAELYAMAVEMPDQLYSDYVAMPAERARMLREALAARRAALQTVGLGSSSRLALTAQIEEIERALLRAEKIVKQRRSLYDIIRNDVLHGDESTRAAVARLKQRGAGAAAIRAFEGKAARASTPKQIAELEREVMP